VYTLVLNQFPNELNVGNLSAVTMWNEFSKDLQIALKDHEKIPIQHRTVKSPQYMNLHFRVRLFYNQYVSAIQKDNVPDYCAWFEPFVMNWLEDNDEISMEYLHNAYEKDKQGSFQQTSEHCKDLLILISPIHFGSSKIFQTDKFYRLPDLKIVFTSSR
jgi:protein unc-13